MILPTGRLNKRVVTKKPSNSSTSSAMDQDRPTRFNPPKNKKPRATVLGQDIVRAQGLRRKNTQSMRRPGLVTSKASGG